MKKKNFKSIFKKTLVFSMTILFLLKNYNSTFKKGRAKHGSTFFKGSCGSKPVFHFLFICPASRKK
jgi:hypothetical protein